MARAKTKSITPDPIFAAIEAHRVAYAEMDHAIGVRNALEGKDKRRFTVAERKADKATDAESDVLDALRASRPKTIEGLAALAAYLHVREQEAHGRHRPDEEAMLLTFERTTARLAKPPHSEDFRHALKLVAAIDAERKRRHAAWRKRQNSPGAKRARGRRQAQVAAL